MSTEVRMPVIVDGRVAYTLEEIQDAFYSVFRGRGECYFFGSTRPEQKEYVEPYFDELVFFLKRNETE